jgi:hypothetical protein
VDGDCEENAGDDDGDDGGDDDDDDDDAGGEEVESPNRHSSMNWSPNPIMAASEMLPELFRAPSMARHLSIDAPAPASINLQVMMVMMMMMTMVVVVIVVVMVMVLVLVRSRTLAPADHHGLVGKCHTLGGGLLALVPAMSPSAIAAMTR